MLDHPLPAHFVLEGGVPEGSLGTFLLPPEHLPTLTSCSEQGHGCPGAAARCAGAQPCRVVCGTQKGQSAPYLPEGGVPCFDACPGPELVEFQEEALLSKDASKERAELISCQMLFLRFCSSGDSVLEGEVAVQRFGGCVVLFFCKDVGTSGVAVGGFVGHGS